MKSIIILVSVMLILTVTAAADLSCSVTTSCSDTDILHLSNYTNAHAELTNETDYSYKVCCEDTGTQSVSLSSSCSGTNFLDLSSSTDAHVEKTSESAYSVDACIYSPDATFTCGYQDSNCNGWDTCLATISDDTDAHIASCESDPYTTRVCCNMTYTNDPPEMTSLSDSPDPAKGGTTVTVTPSGVADTQSDTLSLYCAVDDSDPSSSNTDCTGGTTSDDSPYSMDCELTAPADDSSHTVYCKLFDGEFYSSSQSTTFTSDSTPPSAVTIQNVDGDTSSPYWDTSDNSQTIIQADKPEAGMLCRWSTSDAVYSSISSSNECTMGADSTSCNVGDISESSSYTYHISCTDSVGNDQTTAQNTQVSFGVDWSDPTTSLSGYGSYYLPGHDVTVNENDNVGTTATIITYECHPTTGCTPGTIIDDSDTVSFSTRGTNYIRWYSVDGAGNSQTQQEVAVEINSLPVITDNDMFSGIGGSPYTGKNGQRVMFYCDGTDANGAVDGNSGYSAKIYLRHNGEGTWNMVDGQAMTWSAIDGRFQFDHLLDDNADIYGTSYDMMCEITDDLGEGTNHTENGVFSVVNTPPYADDILVNDSNTAKYSTVRFYCSGADADTPTHQESTLIASFWLRTQGAGSWNKMEGVTMAFDGIDHYVDYYVTDDGNTYYDARCQLSDGVDSSEMYDEFQTEYYVSDDWDGDGTADGSDTLEGTGADLNTSLAVTVLIDGATDNNPSGTKNVSFRDDGDSQVFMFFTNDFDTNEIELPNIQVARTTTNAGSVLVRGLTGISKTINVPKVIAADQVCVKNAEISSISEITSACSAGDEYLFDNCIQGGRH